MRAAMADFFEIPNLPEREVRAVIIGEGYSELLLSPLAALGVTALVCPRNPSVDARLASHADLSVCHIGGTRLLLAPYLKNTEFAERLEQLGGELLFSEKRQGSEYPDDAGLCALNIGAAVFHNRSLSDAAIEKNAAKFIHVSQGYAKCAVCMTDKDSAITADMGIARALENHGIEVLQISPQGVLLEGFSSGFIGGAAFKLSPRELVFTGNLDSHCDKSKIEAFLQKRSIKACFLTKKPVFDIGSAIPVF